MFSTSGPYAFDFPESLLHQRIRWAQLRLDRATDKVLSRIGLSAAKFYILVILGREEDGRLPPSKIGARMLMERSNLTAILDRMERDNLVVREPHPSDRRSLLIRLTDHGRAKLDEGSVLYERAIVQLVQGMSAKQIAQVENLLGKLKLPDVFELEPRQVEQSV